MATNTQGTAVGVVSTVQGEVFARNAQGEMRRLVAGDSVFEGDVIVTANGSSAEITPFDGPVLNVAEQQTVTVDNQVVSTAPAQDATTGTVEPLGATEAARVIQNAGGDNDFNSLVEAEAAAAGLVGGDGAEGGHSFVDLAKINEAVPSVGFNFSTNPAGTAPTIEGVAPVPTEHAPSAPSVSVSVDVIVQPPGGVNPPGGGVLPGGQYSFIGAEGAYVQEGTGGENLHNMVTFILKLDHVSDQAVTVNYEIQPGTAVPGIDYVGTPSHPLSGTVTIPAGATEVHVTVDVIPDAVDEGPNTMAGAEDFFIVLTGASNAVIDPGANTARGFIVDDDSTRINIVSNGNVDEATHPTFTVSVSQVLDQDLTVTLSNNDTVTIKAGETSAIYTAPAQGDDVYVDPGSVTVGLVSANTAGPPSNDFVLGGPATASISDTINVTQVSLSASPAAITEAGAEVTYTATLTHAAQGAVTVNLDNGDVITIADGATQGTVLHTYGSTDDVYVDPGSVSVAISTASGGNFEQLVVDGTPAVVAIADTTDVTTVSITAANVTEDDPGVTFAISLSHAPQGAASVDVQVGGTTYTVALDGAGQGSLFVATQNMDPYVDPSSVTATVTAIHGGNFEATSVEGASATALISDTIDVTQVSLSASPAAITEAGAEVTYTATLTHAAQGAVTVNLDNGDVITIADGATQGTVLHTYGSTDDVYVDPGSISVAISTASGGNFEQLVVDGTPAVVAIADTIDVTHATLTGDLSVVAGGSITYTVTLDNAVRSGDAPVVVTLSNGQEVVIASGLSASVSATAPAAGSDPAVGPVSIDSVTQTPTGSQGSFESLVAQGTVTTDINYTPQITVSNQQVDETGGLDTVAGTLIVNYGGDGAGTVALSAAGAVWSAATHTLTASDGSWMAVDNGNGTYSFTQLQAMSHPNGADPNDAIQISITATATDADGSQSTAPITITVFDDGPTLTASNVAIANVAGTYEGAYAFNVGADLQAFASSFSASSLQWTNSRPGITLSYDAADSSPTSQVYHATFEAGGTTYTFFDLAVNNDGTYGFQLVTPDPVVEVSVSSLLAGISGGSNLSSYTIPSSSFGGLFNLVLTGYSGSGHTADTLTISSNELGVGDNVMQGNKGDVLRFDIQPVSGTHASISELTVDMATTGGAKATDSVDLKIVYTDHSSTTSSQQIGSDFAVTYDIDPTKTVDYVELSPHNSSSSFKIDGVSMKYVVEQFPSDYHLNFSLTGTDADHDAATANFSVSVSATDTGLYHVVGTDGADSIYGTAGADSLTGGLGADVFVWRLADAPAGTTTDKVTDFSSLDSLDLRDLVSHGASLAIDNTAHTVTAIYNDTSGVHTQIVEVTIDAGEPVKTLVNQGGVVKIG